MSILEKGIQPPPRDLGDEMAFNLWLNDVHQNYPRVNTYEIALTPASVGANTTSEQVFTLTGLSTSGIVFVNKPTHTAGIIIGGARVSASNILAITFGNLTAGAITPIAETYKIIEIRR